MKWVKGVLSCALVIMTLTGCGKNIPVIDASLLQSKTSVLVVTGADLPDAAKKSLDSTLVAWRDKNHISFEWMQNTSALTEAQIDKIKSVPYDYVLVVGHALIQAALPAAEQSPERKWVLIDDAVARQQVQVKSNNVLWKQVPEARFQAEWDEWVRQQLVSGRTIEWVTKTGYPIPSEWAPSEEGEYVSMADADGWYPQFQFQVRQHGPNWIAVYAPLDATVLNRMKSLQVPIMNIAATGIELQWDAILAGQLDTMEKHSWKPGIQPFPDNEMKILKNS
ncbi:hypothetical protein [Paenibacillus cremeus]|uniref:Uncharacterized protein n=1 Tax=Paenibacillus cremeus TaxID=2163881 RepID=A0A559KEP6_9BACL|nr:hypothetical protein [Paenibacillus cremeus]TVY10592.1 hypothetical protein FPZ49_07605 [Paenibacillus cremeus]